MLGCIVGCCAVELLEERQVGCGHVELRCAALWGGAWGHCQGLEDRQQGCCSGPASPSPNSQSLHHPGSAHTQRRPTHTAQQRQECLSSCLAPVSTAGSSSPMTPAKDTEAQGKGCASQEGPCNSCREHVGDLRNGDNGVRAVCGQQQGVPGCRQLAEDGGVGQCSLDR